MIFTETKLKGAFVVDIERREDSRGFFARVFCQHEFAAHGLKPIIAQANIAFNRQKGTMRGMHFQFPPAAETKFVRATRGAILDVLVDLRPESPTYLQHVAVELSEENCRAIYVPGALRPRVPSLAGRNGNELSSGRILHAGNGRRLVVQRRALGAEVAPSCHRNIGQRPSLEATGAAGARNQTTDELGSEQLILRDTGFNAQSFGGFV